MVHGSVCFSPVEVLPAGESQYDGVSVLAIDDHTLASRAQVGHEGAQLFGGAARRRNDGEVFVQPLAHDVGRPQVAGEAYPVGDMRVPGEMDWPLGRTE